MDSIVRTLRQRAAHLRLLAADLDGAPARSLGSSAGTDTWVSDAADAYRTRLVEFDVDLDDAARDLREQAIILERQAADREADLIAAAAAAAAAEAEAEAAETRAEEVIS